MRCAPSAGPTSSGWGRQFQWTGRLRPTSRQRPLASTPGRCRRPPRAVGSPDQPPQSMNPNAKRKQTAAGRITQSPTARGEAMTEVNNEFRCGSGDDCEECRTIVFGGDGTVEVLCDCNLYVECVCEVETEEWQCWNRMVCVARGATAFGTGNWGRRSTVHRYRLLRRIAPSSCGCSARVAPAIRPHGHRGQRLHGGPPRC